MLISVDCWSQSIVNLSWLSISVNCRFQLIVNLRATEKIKRFSICWLYIWLYNHHLDEKAGSSHGRYDQKVAEIVVDVSYKDCCTYDKVYQLNDSRNDPSNCAILTCEAPKYLNAATWVSEQVRTRILLNTNMITFLGFWFLWLLSNKRLWWCSRQNYGCQ